MSPWVQQRCRQHFPHAGRVRRSRSRDLRHASPQRFAWPATTGTWHSHKIFVFSENRGSSLEFRAEAYNMWNHTQLRADVISGNYGAALTGSNFGVITQAYDPRVFQLGLKLTF